MATPLADLLEVLLKSLTDRLALAALFGCLFLRISMFFPDTGIGKWSNDHGLWIFFGILFPICYLPTRHIFDWIEKWQLNRKRNARLHNLTKREKEILAPYIAENNDFRVGNSGHSSRLESRSRLRTVPASISFHRWCNPKRLVNSAEVIVHVVQSDGPKMIVYFLAESIGQPRKAAHPHPHR